MTHAEAVAFLKHAGPWRGAWADVGAGTGTFTRALAELLGADGSVLAIDRDARALTRLQRDVPRADRAPSRLERDSARAGCAPITVLPGDMHALSSLLEDAVLDGALFANVLHFTRRPGEVLAQAAHHLQPGGRIVVIEYDRRLPNPWVPHPLPPDRLADVAERAGLGAPTEVARRASAYHREMYCAVLTR